jgi:peroxiredoxin
MVCVLMRGTDPKLTNGILQQATAALLEDHIEERDLGGVALLMTTLPHTETKAFLRALIKRSPHREVRAYACLALATNLQRQAEDKPGGAAATAAEKEIVALLKRINDEFADVKLHDRPLSELAQPLLFEKENLSVGKKAPEIVGTDAEGNEIKLSRFRGKVVLLDFWGDWCPHCVRLYPHERVLVSKYKERKFVLLGVNTDSPERLERAEKEKKVTWRSFADGPMPGPIAKQWNVDAIPSMYILDHKGVIRFKGNFDPDELNQAIEPLIAEAEGKSRPGRSKSSRLSSSL